VPDEPLVPDPVAGNAERAGLPFQCTATAGGLDAAWVHVSGELDIATTPELERTLRASRSDARLVVLDLRDLAFMDSSGVHAIVDASLRARQAVRRLVLLRAPPDLDRIFTLTGSAGELEIGDVDPLTSRIEVLLQLGGQHR
jgi:anti-sigma B factor antagonist